MIYVTIFFCLELGQITDAVAGCCLEGGCRNEGQGVQLQRFSHGGSTVHHRNLLLPQVGTNPHTLPGLSHIKPWMNCCFCAFPTKTNRLWFCHHKIFILLPCFRFAHPLQKAELDRKKILKGRNNKKKAYVKLRLKSKVFLPLN